MVGIAKLLKNVLKMLENVFNFLTGNSDNTEIDQPCWAFAHDLDPK